MPPDAATWRKLGVRPGHRLVLLHAPRHWDGAAPPGVEVRRRRGAPADVVLAFYGSAAALAREAPTLPDAITVGGAVWVAWPRKAAGHVSDLSDEVVRAALLGLGLVDVKVARLDEDWSGLRFVWRRERRAAVTEGRAVSSATRSAGARARTARATRGATPPPPR